MLLVLLPHRYKYVCVWGGGKGWAYLETSIIEFLSMSLAADSVVRLYRPRPLSSSKLVCTAEDRKEMRRKIKDIFLLQWGKERGVTFSRDEKIIIKKGLQGESWGAMVFPTPEMWGCRGRNDFKVRV